MKCGGYFVLIVCFLLSSCSSQIGFNTQEMKSLEIALQELQTEVADVKHALNNAQVELQLLDEKFKTQDVALKSQAKSSSYQQLTNQIALVEKKLLQLEKAQEKTVGDLMQLGAYANQTSAMLGQYKEKISELQQLLASHTQRLDEIIQLKSTLSSISKAMQGSSNETSLKTYRVKSGDSLEKIARRYQMTVEELKKLNQLESDRIVIGQELKIGH